LLTRKFILLLNVSGGFCFLGKTAEVEADVAIAHRVTMGEAALQKKNDILEALNLRKEFEEGPTSAVFMKEFYTYKTKGNWRNCSSKRN
jgi:hypothetical protein